MTVRSATMEEWFAIHGLFVRYATSLDHGDVESVVACFLPDATLESPVLGKFAGHAGIRDFARRTANLLQDGVQFRHVVSNLVADVDGDRGNARCYLLDFRTRAGRTQLLSPGEYRCDLRKVDGDWRFATRVVTMDQPFSQEDL
jgi:3-phenylpropionate/cinnamic acid dioxygenase small subunit